jgi:hypothetical protein
MRCTLAALALVPAAAMAADPIWINAPRSREELERALVSGGGMRCTPQLEDPPSEMRLRCGDVIAELAPGATGCCQIVLDRETGEARIDLEEPLRRVQIAAGIAAIALARAARRA